MHAIWKNIPTEDEYLYVYSDCVIFAKIGEVKLNLYWGS